MSVKQVTVWDGNQQEENEGKEKVKGVREGEGRAEYGQSALYTCIKIE